MKLFTQVQISNVTIKQVVIMKNNRNYRVSFPVLIPIPDFCQSYTLPLPQLVQQNPLMSLLISPHNILSFPSHLLISSHARGTNEAGFEAGVY